MNKTISIGAIQNEYLAFGDDSQFNDTLAFAFVIIRSDKIEYVQNKVKRLKKLYNIPESTPLHSRVLFSGHARDKAGLSHLTPYMIKNIITKIVDLINRTPMYLRYAFCNLSEHVSFFEQMESRIELSDKDKQLKKEIPLNPDPKGLLGCLAHLSLATPPKDDRVPSYEKCQIIISEDRTKVKFLGEHGRQAHKWSEGFSDIGSDGNTVFKMQPVVQKFKENLMLELADIMAYVCSHAIGTHGNPFFLSQLNRVKNWTSARYYTREPSIENNL
ncbi:hypothetical protein OQJ13_12455 [Legionella sp. PATHC035]|uniref:hypothetical protein n=1 Tax=Legionella sp. PATHC035 TaxID=2992040 RepID=UPI002243173D|nr:hypothetical protein [Legionella sp. PATHC035]MCW8409781.1 hypothetical protein [Legionella sp. PATHC035]